MITRVLCLLFLLALSSGVAKSQSSIKGLTPGKSTGVSRAGFYSRELFNNTSVKLTLSSKNLPGLNAASTAKNSSAQPTPPVADYDTLITRANSATQSRDFQTTIKLAQQAMAIDPN